MPGFKRYIFPLAITAVIAVGACTKGSDAPTRITQTANLNVINAVTDVNAINFYLNGTRQNTSSAIFPGSTSGYNAFAIGQQQYQFKVDSQSRTLLADVALNLPKKDSSYTVVFTGLRKNNTLTTIFTKDIFTSDTSNTTSTRIRFIQASQGTQVYDVFVGDTLSFKNQSFKNTTAFLKTGPGKKTVTVKVAGTSTVLLTTSVTVLSASYYTLFTYGQPNQTGANALATGIILNR